MKSKKFISIIVPCFNEEKSILLFYKKIIDIIDLIQDIDFNILFIDDGSIDDTLTIIKRLLSKNSNIKYISFSRNFGKEAAIYAGLKNCYNKSDFVVLMDVDLQDPPELLIEMYNLTWIAKKSPTS